MFSRINSLGIRGVEGYLACVEVDVGNGLPGFTMVGYLSAQVREAEDRVKTALKNAGFSLPAKKITVNLSPADIRKEGTGFDLAIAVAVEAAYGLISDGELRQSAFFGELGLDGSVKPILGVLPRVEAARQAGITRCFVPMANVREATVIPHMGIVGVEDLGQLTSYLKTGQMEEAARFSWEDLLDQQAECYEEDFSQVNGQLLMRRATEIAVAGMHNILYIGPAGTGKTMVAKRIPTIMPSITMEESVQISKIYSVCGQLMSDRPLLTKRPFRSPHHSITPQALIGGGLVPKPGEVSLACHGILFLDELAEFKDILDLLREPMEEKRIRISRCHGSFDFPANTMVVAAMNPCKCGHYPNRSRCRCSKEQVMRYLGRISKPLLDRIDLCVQASEVSYEELTVKRKNECSARIRERIEKVRRLQQQRFAGRGIYFNSEMRGEELRDFCRLNQGDQIFFKQTYDRLGLSARTYEKILRVSRTIADLDLCDHIKRQHLGEAISYCTFKETYWGGGT